MDNLKLGGFPPLIKKDLKIKVDPNQKELKSQFFSNVQRQNINIREILSNNSSIFEDKKEEKLEELESI